MLALLAAVALAATPTPDDPNVRVASAAARAQLTRNLEACRVAIEMPVRQAGTAYLRNFAMRHRYRDADRRALMLTCAAFSEGVVYGYDSANRR